MNREASSIKVMIVAEQKQQRHAFSDTVRSCGFQLVDCISGEQLMSYELSTEVDLWLVDGQSDSKVIAVIDSHQPNKLLVGFSDVPYINQIELYNRWQRKLKRKLAETLGMPELAKNKIYDQTEQDWKYVVFIAASMGGPTSVKEFLDCLPTDLPISLLLAHHFNPDMLHTLPRILNRHNDWRLEIVSSNQSLRTGRCLIAPINQQIVCDSHGRVFLIDEAWEGGYKPCISQLFKNVSDVYGADLIGIVFSGMGDDGALYLEQMQENNSKIWAQDPKSCVSPSQPTAIIESGFCQFVGTPKQLADKLIRLVKQA